MTPAEMYRGVVVSAYSYSVAKENLSTRIRQKKKRGKRKKKENNATEHKEPARSRSTAKPDCDHHEPVQYVIRRNEAAGQGTPH